MHAGDAMSTPYASADDVSKTSFHSSHVGIHAVLAAAFVAADGWTRLSDFGFALLCFGVSSKCNF